MRRGTTPTIVITLTDEDGTPSDLSGFDVHVTLKGGGAYGRKIDKTGPDVEIETTEEETTVSVTLSQDETLGFKSGKPVRLQIRATDGDKAVASDIAEFMVEEILLEGRI